MNRRDFLRTTAAAAVTVKASLGAHAAAPTTKRPNVLYVFSDQHRVFSMTGEPHNQVQTPNISAFRDANCSMSRCVSNYPLCSPYRAILMSGLYPQQSGMMGNQDILSPSCGPLGETFRNAGYHTGYIGKWHIHGSDRGGGQDARFIPKGPYRMGFEDWHVWADTDDHYHSWTFNQDTGEKIYPQGWQPVRMTDEAIDFFKAQTPDKPWMLILSWNPPHPQFDPPEEFASMYPKDKLVFRPNERILADAQALHKGVKSEASLDTKAQGYFGNITGIDKEFGRVMQALKDSGMADDTIVIYTSDHGEMMGSQGLLGKRVPFEESCRVPFVVRYPGVTPKRHKSDMLFSAIDIYPTVCGLAGVPVPEHCAGRDLSAAMRGRPVKGPDHVFLLSQPELRAAGHGDGASQGDGAAALGGGRRGGGGKRGGGRRGGGGGDEAGESGCPPYRGVRTATHTYVVAEAGRWLLFDNAADPYQMHNLVNDKSQLALMEELDAKVEAWLQKMKDTFPYSSAKSSTVTAMA